MDSKDPNKWELRLGLLHVVIILGITTGIMTSIFFVGFFTGRHNGYDMALNAGIANTVKYPIAAQDLEQEDAEAVASDVYAKLSETRDQKPAVEHGKEEAVPSLGSIESTDTSPVHENLPADGASGNLNPEHEGAEPHRVAEESGQDQPSRTEEVPLINPSGSVARRDAVQRTLGEALDDGTESGAPVAVAVTPAATVTPRPVQKTPTPAPAAVKQASTPTPRPTPKKPTPVPTKASTVAGKGWFAQVAAPKKREDANELSSRLRQSGFNVMIEVADVRGERYFRVLVGPEANRAQADQLIGQLKRERYIQSDPFARLIK